MPANSRWDLIQHLKGYCKLVMQGDYHISWNKRRSSILEGSFREKVCIHISSPNSQIFNNMAVHYDVSAGHSIPQQIHYYYYINHYCCYCLNFSYLQILHLFNSVKGITDPTFHDRLYWCLTCRSIFLFISLSLQEGCNCCMRTGWFY